MIQKINSYFGSTLAYLLIGISKFLNFGIEKSKTSRRAETSYSIVLILLVLPHCLIVTLGHSQTLSASVMPTAGGYYAAGNSSLSFTIGETVTSTFSAGGNMLTQGFQQPYKMTLNLKAFIEGYYLGGGVMENVLYNQGVTSIAGNECDTITIQLRQSTPPFNLVSENKSIIQTNGYVNYTGTGSVGLSYYIVIKHRNAIETWSSNPVQLNENTFYDFSSASTQAYGNNMSQVESGVWALYSGDLNADENVDLLDFSLLDNDITAFQFGYFATDINGDANVDLLDAPIVETNINGFIFSGHP